MKKLLLLLLIIGCEEPAKHGCLDSQACNYDSEASIDNNSCWYTNDGCSCSDGQDAVADNCGVCDIDNTNDNTTCSQDCTGIWGGTANDLLVLSKLEENKLDNKSLVISNEPLLPLINSAIFECKSLIDNKSINVNIECDTEISILQNSHLLLQAFTNLINNAVKYSKINSDVFIKARKKDSTVELLFIDQGIGIEDKHLPRLFERFYRVDESRSRDAGGTGLGLSIVKHICNLHNAKINVTSSINEGTTFSIIFHN